MVSDRPMFNLSFISKVLERTVTEQLVIHLNESHLLDKFFIEFGSRLCFLSKGLIKSVLKHFRTTPDSRLPLMSFTMTGRRMSRYSMAILVGIGSTVE